MYYKRALSYSSVHKENLQYGGSFIFSSFNDFVTIFHRFKYSHCKVKILVSLIISFIQKYYFASAKELMRLNGTTKSFVANHLAESVAGAVTIRAFEEEDRFFQKNLDLIDVNASPYFHSFAANEWLIQRLETVSAVVLASAALCMVVLPPGSFSSGETFSIIAFRKLHFVLFVQMMFFIISSVQCKYYNVNL